MSLNRRTFVTTATLAGGLGACASTSGTPAPQASLPGRTFTKLYVFPKPLDETWRAYTDSAIRAHWFHGAPLTTSAPQADPASSDPPYSSRAVVDHPGLPGPTENMSYAEAVAGGTQITYIGGGYGNTPVWEAALQSSANGVDEMMSDFGIYLRTGAVFPRHAGVAPRNSTRAPNPFYFTVRDAPGGVEVFQVDSGTLAAEAGMQPGDTIVALDNAPIFTIRDIRLFSRLRTRGDMITLTWVRGDQIMTGSGHMTEALIQWRNDFNPEAYLRARDARQSSDR